MSALIKARGERNALIERVRAVLLETRDEEAADRLIDQVCRGERRLYLGGRTPPEELANARIADAFNVACAEAKQLEAEAVRAAQREVEA